MASELTEDLDGSPACGPYGHRGGYLYMLDEDGDRDSYALPVHSRADVSDLIALLERVRERLPP